MKASQATSYFTVRNIYKYLYLYVCCARQAVSHGTADVFEQALLALSGCWVVVSRLYFALHSSAEQEMHMKTTQINTEDG